MQAKRQLQHLKPYKPGKNVEDVQEELGLTKIVKLASNENPFGCSEAVKRAIEKEMSELAVYPDGYATVLREKTAHFLNVGTENLIFGDGSDEVIQMICRAYLTADDNTVMAAPTFPQYKHNAVVEGAEIREVPVRDGRHDLERMIEAIDEKTKIVWLCMVNNPSGEYIRDKELASFLSQVPEKVLVVCDEAYYEYVVADDYPDTLSFMNEHRNLVITRTFSKAYGLAALRVGYGIANTSVIAAIESVRQPFNTSRIGQLAAAAALEDQPFIDHCRKLNREGLEKFYRFCRRHELTYYPSQGNFILIDFARSGDEIYDYLLRKGYIVRSGTALGYPNAVRITIGSEDENDDIIEHLQHYFQHQTQ
ncbi:MAG TPA: histidinol-phosphate transaminase [Bacillales bacterium]|nr:histidinol-phosphate transaminase [Bacillales bacterium]